MKIEKHTESLKEVEEEIESSLKDHRGLSPHQRRLAFSISLGMTNVIELYLHRLNVIKEGSKINHLWFKKRKENVLELIQNQIVPPVNSIKNIEKIIDIAIKIEEKRDDLVYGVSVSEKVLQEKINLFLDLRRITEC
jgi:hypothetical protein